MYSYMASQLLQYLNTTHCVNYICIFGWQGAGNAVKRATDALVQAALAAKRRGQTTYEEEVTIEVNERTVGGITQLVEAREEILRKEKVIFSDVN